MNKNAIFLFLLLACPGLSAQEVTYVTDILRLGIHRAQDTSDRPFQNLVSGTELTVLDRVTNYAHVRTSDGQEGWVKSAYLVSEKPAQLRVAEVEAELATAREQLALARSAQTIAEAEAGRVSKEMAENTSSAGAIQETLARLQRENESFESQLERYRGSLPWPWVVAALVVAVIAGFFGGMWWLDASMRRRFGVRIY